jgi:hypothetical protein
LLEAYERALACDPTSAFGGIVALNSKLDAATAAKVLEIFTEVVIAPDADEDAVALFRKKKNVRLLTTGGLPDPDEAGDTFRSVSGGFLVQSRDTARLTPADLKVVTKRAPTDEEVRDMLFAFTIAKHVKSNAIVYARSGQTLGIGAGQMNRKDSARIAALRAADFGLDLKGSACASEAFFPFPDGLIQAADAGCTAVIQPGGSIGDDKVIGRELHLRRRASPASASSRNAALAMVSLAKVQPPAESSISSSVRRAAATWSARRALQACTAACAPSAPPAFPASALAMTARARLACSVSSSSISRRSAVRS